MIFLQENKKTKVWATTTRAGASHQPVVARSFVFCCQKENHKFLEGLFVFFGNFGFSEGNGTLPRIGLGLHAGTKHSCFEALNTAQACVLETFTEMRTWNVGSCSRLARESLLDTFHIDSLPTYLPV